MIHTLAIAVLALSQGTGQGLKTFKLPPDESAKDVFSQAAPRDWAVAYPVTLKWPSDDPRPEDEFVRAYLDHLSTPELVQVFSDKNTNGPLLKKQLIAELARMVGMSEGAPSTIYPAPSGGEYGIKLGPMDVPFAKTVEVDLVNVTSFTVTADQAAVLRHVAETLERYEQSRHDASRAVTAQRMSEINEAWKNYLQNGYSQYPWELLINSSLYRGPWYQPPDHQLVVFHPEVGFSADVLHGASEADLEVALMVHALGYIRYTGTSNDSYFGGSLSFMYDDEDKLAAGLAAHLGFAKFGTALPAFTVGVYWKDFDHGFSSGNLELGMSIDLLRLFDREGGDKAFLQQALQQQ